jgi:hypothetical protein
MRAQFKLLDLKTLGKRAVKNVQEVVNSLSEA